MTKEVNFENFLHTMKEKNYRNIKNTPVQMMLGLTNVCNLHCAFCPYCGFCMQKIEKVEELPRELICKLKPYFSNAKFINPSGRGEPLLYTDFMAFIDICREANGLEAMQLINNGTQLNKIDMKKLDGINVVSISVDSVNKEIFELLRSGAKFQQVMENVKELRKKLPNTILQWTVVVNRLNIFEIYDIYKMASEIGINYITYNDVFGYEEDKAIQLLRLRKSDYDIIRGQFKKIESDNQGKMVVNNVIAFDDYEDGVVNNQEEIITELKKLRRQVPYLNFDKINSEDVETRRIKVEKKSGEKTPYNKLPYCTCPFSVMLIQPNRTVSPCCADFGTIDKIEENDIEKVWTGENYGLLREAMFNYEMLPDYCKKCNAFCRYDYINEYIDFLKNEGELCYESLVIPPNFNPPANMIKDKEVMRKIEHEKYVKDSKMKYTINSQKYWDNRFGTDWKDYSGNEQTKYFATILNETLPDWIVREINENRDNICDLGCAEGDALPIYRTKFLNAEIYGEDFSQQAIEIAKENYPEFNYKVSNILKPEQEKKYEVVICSNVVEHFKDTYNVLKNICERATKYAIILIPYRETLGQIEEHERVFHTKDIPVNVENNFLIYAKSYQCDSIYYPGEQMLLIYAKNKNHYLLSDYTENVFSDREKAAEKELIEKENELAEKEAEINKNKLDAEQKINLLHAEYEQKFTTFTADYEKKIMNLISEYEEKVSKAEEGHLQQVEDISEGYQQKINYLSAEINRMNQDILQSNAVLRQKDEYIYQTQELCNHFATGKLMQLNHFLFRIKGQLIHGSKEQRQDFWRWLGGRIRKTNKSLGAGTTYNPWMVVNEKLKEAAACKINLVQGDVVGISMAQQEKISLPEKTCEILEQDYTAYDVIILSVIDYNFRHQRPQHFADRFAANGHRVFYINANFVRQDSVTEEKKNLFVVDFSYPDCNAIYATDGKNSLPWMKEKFSELINLNVIRDAVIIVDYPNWVYGAEYMRERYGFKIVTDYMDDYTGFIGTAEDFLKDNCISLLKTSDMISASSQFLYDVASSHTSKEKIEIIRNGTEVEHFYKALKLENKEKKRKVIGYYGAVAHWFAWEKVCYLAKKFPEYDIVIVGEVSEHKDKLSKYDNVKLLGEKPYVELPKYLADFDVCLIPFDTSTDLIKATNPVKFYEYLSAGKKVVATEIPELMPFKDEFVYMSNDDEQFAQYVQMCMEGTDKLKGIEECIAFARENDWQMRFEKFEEACTLHVPKVSIIVLTYNNRKINKDCIESILQKTAYPNYELIIIDNHSTDGTVEYLEKLKKENIPNVNIVFNEENLGFAGGNNCGIKLASGEYVILLNNDTVVTKGWITNLVKHLENNSDYAMCNPVTNSIGNESKIAASYKGKRAMERFAYSYTTNHMGEEFEDVDRLPLFSTIIRKDVIDEVGLLDDEYKVGMFEDDDFTEHVIRAGYDIVIAEDVFIHHINNGSFKKLDNKEYKKIFETNKRIFEEKWHKKWHMPKYREGVDWDTNNEVTL